MSAAKNQPSNRHLGTLTQGSRTSRARLTVLSLIAVVVLSACGGGGDNANRADFNIGVTVGGQFMNNTPVAPGGSINLAIHAGQSLNLDAGEPAVWTLIVGGNAISGGARVSYAGVDIRATTLNQFAVAVDTFAPYPLQVAVPITLVATSTFDSVQVATVNLLITN